MEINKQIGVNIKLLREKLCLTQKQLADYLTITREEVAFYENGNRKIPTNIINKTSQLFGVDEYDLYQEDSEFRETNLAFAFRAESLNNHDLEKIASFKKIVQNYLKMHKALESEQ